MQIEVTPPRVSVIIPTRNRPEIIVDCLSALNEERGSYKGWSEVVIVDASSTGDTDAAMRPYLSGSVRHISIGDVKSSSGLGRNVGMRRATGDLYVFIDDDSIVQTGWLATLLEPYRDTAVGAVGGRVIYHPWRAPTLGGDVARLNLEEDTLWGAFDTVTTEVVEVPHLFGANCSVRASVAALVGGFDTSLVGTGHLEETDYFLRVRNLGYSILYHPNAVVEHQPLPVLTACVANRRISRTDTPS